jgi:hypothetical protein
MIQFLQKIAVVWAKNAIFFAEKFSENILKNHNIGPWLIINHPRVVYSCKKNDNFALTQGVA